jgi:hypothetical protein
MPVIRYIALIVLCFQLTEAPRPKLLFRSKPKGLFQTKSEIIYSDGKVKLVFSVSSLTDVDQAAIQWRIPDDVKLLSGQRLIQTQLKKSKTQVFELEVQELGREPVRAEVFTIKDKFKFGAIGSFFSESEKVQPARIKRARILE